ANEVVSNAGLVAGTYTLTATAPNGNANGSCSATTQVTITQPAIAVTVSGIATNASCFGEANGSIAVTNSAGSTVVITNAANEVVSNTGLVAGTYTLTATAPNGNANGSCSATTQVTITQPAAAINATAIITNNNNCVRCSNGTITQTVSGGTALYTYLWSNGATSKDLTGLLSGNYSVVIKDANGCTATYTYAITESGIALVKTAAVGGTGKLGDVITYTFAVTNTGNTSLTNVIVTDTMAGLTITGNPIATLAIGASSSAITGTYTIKQSDIDAGKVVNTALATAKDPNNKDVTDVSGTSVDNNEPTDTPLTQKGKIALVKTAAVGGTGKVGDVITYTFAVTNTGNTSLSNVIVTDPMLGLSITGNPIATFAVGASNATIKGTYTIKQSDIDAGKVVNTALATAKDPKGNDVTDISGTSVDNNTPTDTPLTQTPRIALVKTAVVSGTGKLGDVITYTFAVTNTGNTSLTNVVVTDPMVGLTITGNPIATLAVGASSSAIKGTYTITQSDIDAGKVVNTALATAKDPNNKDVTDISGTSVDNNTPTDTPLTQTPRIALVKTAVVSGTGKLGDVITYTFAVTNTGNTSLTNVVVTDPMVGLTITGNP
ncbi:beta strand repeat-containing protein, partial [Flavobacterium weaverense]|uniref:beta strand repeat-containing protein n=1 Tax=Flavobacterium weaverense TaxID=271156 RepID=UPI000EF97A60